MIIPIRFIIGRRNKHNHTPAVTQQQSSIGAPSVSSSSSISSGMPSRDDGNIDWFSGEGSEGIISLYHVL